jgi:uncharacterized protein (TIGR04255 family)
VPIQLPPSPLEHLPRAPLRLAIVQVRYGPVLKIESAEAVAQFQERLGRDYELVGREMTSVVQIFVGDEVLEHPQTTPETLWRFSHESGGWTVALSPSSLGFEATEYHRFDAFVDEYERVVKTLAEVFKPPSQRRIGVRYINEIRDPRVTGALIGELVNAPLAAPIGTELGSDVSSSLAEWLFEQPDGRVVIRHGIVAPETYLLDFDYFAEEKIAFSPAGIRERVAAYHSTIESLFVWSITKNYLAELRKPKDPDR